MVTTLTEREVDALIRALKYWRAHREPGDVRHNDQTLGREELDLLLAKLTSCTLGSRPIDDTALDLLQN